MARSQRTTRLNVKYMPNLPVIAPSLQTQVDEWLEELTRAEQREREPISFKDDPIAMACASYRAWRVNFANRWLELGAVVVQPEDREKAAALKTYYRSRMTWQALQNGSANMSAYRKKLAAIVSDTHTYTKEDIGILHRLPYFYDEDLAVDWVFEQTQDVAADTSPQEFHGQLRPLKRVLRSRRAGEYIDFYWTSPESTAPYVLVVKHDNPLISMIESFFKRPEITAKARAHYKHPRGYHHGRMYFQLGMIEVL